MKKILTILIFSLSWMNLFSQTTIQFINPSFEGIPKPSAYIYSWSDCGSKEFEGDSPSDLQPGSFGVDMEPVEGSTYLGMVTRAYGSYESVCQELEADLIADSLYQFSIYLAKSGEYASPISPKDPLYIQREDPIPLSRKERKAARKKGIKHESSIVGIVDSVDYTQNCILRIWGGSSLCSKEELLCESAEIDHTDWQKYNILFSPTVNNLQFISLEAYYPDETKFTRGNLMLDFTHD